MQSDGCLSTISVLLRQVIWWASYPSFGWGTGLDLLACCSLDMEPVSKAGRVLSDVVCGLRTAIVLQGPYWNGVSVACTMNKTACPKLAIRSLA
jgi:hypothetical protein